MTSRDTSADTTLDNANEGIMSNVLERFRKEFIGEKTTFRDRQFYTYGSQSRQPEIDALKVQVEDYKQYVDGVSDQLREANKAVNALKAENERLREALQASLQWIDSVPSDTLLPTMPGFDRDYVDGLLAKDFSTTVKEE